MDVGVIGIGSMGKNHVRVYSKIKQVDNIYVVDKKKENVDQVKEFGVTVCDSDEELLKKVDAVSICVPTSIHFDLAKKAIEHNVHPLIEKPVTLTVDEGEQLLDMIDNDLVVGVGHIERFNPIVEEIDRVANEFQYCEIKRHNPASTRITDTTVVSDLMIHDIDIIFNVFFPNQDYEMQSAGNSDVCGVLINFDDAVVSVSTSRLASKKLRYIYAEQEDLTVEGNFMLQEVFVYKKPDKYGITDDRYVQENIIEKVLTRKVEPLHVELSTFIDCINNNKPFPVTPAQAVNNLKICEKIEKRFT